MSDVRPLFQTLNTYIPKSGILAMYAWIDGNTAILQYTQYGAVLYCFTSIVHAYPWDVYTYMCVPHDDKYQSHL